MLLRLERYYSIRHVMVEFNYITPKEFMDGVLEIVEELGMLPPPNPNNYDLVPTVTPMGNLDYSFKREWEKE
jgi:hypothetical protein